MVGWVAGLIEGNGEEWGAVRQIGKLIKRKVAEKNEEYEHWFSISNFVNLYFHQISVSVHPPLKLWAKPEKPKVNLSKLEKR